MPVGVVQAVVVSAILLVATVLRLADPVPVAAVRNAGFDQLQRWFPRPAEPIPLRVVDVDEESLARVGQWPWPRSVLGDLSRKLDAAGASVVAFDMLFAEPDRGAREADGSTATDRRFAEALAGTRAVLGMALVNEATGASAAGKGGISVVGPDPAPGLLRFAGAVRSLPVLGAAAKGEGAINAVPDHDGVVRRLPLFLAKGDQIVPSLAAEALRVAQGAAGYVLRTDPDGGIVARIGNLFVPVDGRGELWLHYSDQPETARTPAWRILDGSALDGLKGAVVLVGSSSAGLKDIRTTPVAQAVAGVDIQAEAVANMLLGAMLARPGWATAGEIAYVAAVALIAVLLAAWRGLPAAAVTILFAVAGAAATSAAAFAGDGVLLDATYPMAVLLLILSGQLVALYQRTEAERRRVREAFQRYLSPVLVERLAARPDRLVLGGETRRLSVLFCDIRDFSRRAGGLDPQTLTDFVNRVMTPLSDEVLASGGTVDKFLGDGLMAFWNAPVDEPDHAGRACRAALAMASRLEAINRDLESVLPPEMRPVGIGVGIDTGDCCVGNFGSLRRFDYSALGETVNFAARFEALSRIYGVTLVIGEATRAAAPGFATIELDETVVRGAVRAVRVHALLGGPEMAATDAFRALAAAHGELRAAMALGETAAARAALERCRALDEGALRHFHDWIERRLSAGGPSSAGGL